MEKDYVNVRFANANKIYTYERNNLRLNVDDWVIVEAKKTLKLAQVLGFVDKPSVEETKPVIRKASEEDIAENKRLAEKALEATPFAQEAANNLNLDMRFIGAEYSIDASQLALTYVADQRIDFRELLKVLAAHFHCRIELRQVGLRDKAKEVGGIGVCGRQLCCNNYMQNFERISINMAKNQLLALNISKLSGHCGSLMCCLRYEDDAYTELRKGLPKLNSKLEYEGEIYRLSSMNVLERKCKLENQDHVLFLDLDDVLSRAKYKKVEEDSEETVEEA